MATQPEIDQLTTEVGDIATGLQTVTATVATVEADAAAASAKLQEEIDNLAAANPGLDLTALKAAVAPVTAAVAPLEAAVTTLGTHVTALGSLAPLTPTPAPAPTPPAPAAGPDKPVYQHATTAPVNAEQWPASGFETAPTDGSAPQPLYFFSGDSVGGQPTGASAEWTVYTGPTQAVPAA